MENEIIGVKTCKAVRIEAYGVKPYRAHEMCFVNFECLLGQREGQIHMFLFRNWPKVSVFCNETFEVLCPVLYLFDNRDNVH